MAYFPLDEIRVASPCTAEWSSMSGDDFARHCGECKKNVYDLSMLTRAEASELIREKEGNLCVRFYRRFDGTALTADCPVGLRKIRLQYIKTRTKLVAAALALWGVVASTSSSCTSTNKATASKAQARDSAIKKTFDSLQLCRGESFMGDVIFRVDTTK